MSAAKRTRQPSRARPAGGRDGLRISAQYSATGSAPPLEQGVPDVRHLCRKRRGERPRRMRAGVRPPIHATCRDARGLEGPREPARRSDAGDGRTSAPSIEPRAAGRDARAERRAPSPSAPHIPRRPRCAHRPRRRKAAVGVRRGKRACRNDALCPPRFAMMPVSTKIMPNKPAGRSPATPGGAAPPVKKETPWTSHRSTISCSKRSQASAC